MLRLDLVYFGDLPNRRRIDLSVFGKSLKMGRMRIYPTFFDTEAKRFVNSVVVILSADRYPNIHTVVARK